MNNNIIVENSGLEIHQNTEFSTSIPENSSGSQEPSSYSTQDFRRSDVKIEAKGLKIIQARAVREVQAITKGLKWNLQRVAKDILKPERSIFVTFSGDTKPTYIKDKWHRFRSCYKTPISKEVDIVHSKSSKKAHFSNVSTCSNVHSCPVCSSYIAARRCDEIRLGMKNHFEQSPRGSVSMMVLTHSHTRHDVLKDTLDKLKEAMEIFQANWFVKSTFKKYEMIGKIRAFEITYSKLNGWHPHFHILWFSSQKVDIKTFRDILSPYWIKALESVGLSGSGDRALNVYGGEYASQYVTKLAEEISLSQSKLGNITGGIPHYTPFQLLDYVHMNEGKDDTSWAKTAFYEYSETMRGRKSLVWSRGLKDILKVRELSDDEASQPSELDLMVYVSVSSGDWLNLTKSATDYRPMILQAAEMGKDVLIKYLASLGVPVIDRGEYQYIKKTPIIERR
ncbi:MAG: hypothetical protein NT118_13915 [Lentisphaerae bacterium]|nr:hypothetical protein [Lentisphaerota bacterium]